MRLIAQFDSEEKAQKFLFILQSKDIESHIDKEDETFQVWVKGEDQLPLAAEMYRDFLAGKIEEVKKPEPITQAFSHLQEEAEPIAFMAPLTRFFIFVCLIIYLASYYQESKMKRVQHAVFPRFTEVQKQLMYDYPIALEFAKELTEQYEMTKESELDKLPQAGQELLQKIEKNPPWSGFYNVITHWQDRGKLLQAELFSNILKGEVWRVWTPTILHAELLHFLFNMLWLWLLGKMMEKNMKFSSYLAFVVVVAAITNTLQYLMTGPFFMGFSGVVAAMAGYIWVRKKKAPWEIYPIDFGTLIFLWIFIFGMLALQIVAFFLEMLHIVSFQISIANTAHVSGVVLGMLFGRIRVFQRKL